VGVVATTALDIEPMITCHEADFSRERFDFLVNNAGNGQAGDH
jgi:hypothetical protein